MPKASQLPPKIAIYYDWLNQWGGAERLLLDILSLFPQAHLYTTFYQPSACNWLPRNTPVFSTPLSRLPTRLSRLPPTYPLAVPFLESFNFEAYDIVISLTSQNGHCLITPPRCLYLCYCLTPNRYLYLTRPHPLISLYRPVDKIFSRRPDYYWAISPEVRHRISAAYNLPSRVVTPGINTDFFTPSPNSKKAPYFLLVSRLVPHKNIDTAIRAALLSGVRLNIIGTGRHYAKLKQIDNPNRLIRFLQPVSDYKLRTFYRRARALVCPQVEDFGLSPLEALACGTPVIALNKGGIPDNLTAQTGLTYNQNDPQVLAQILSNFNDSGFRSSDCRRHALNFSRRSFMLNFKNQLFKLWQQHQNDY